MLKSVEVIHLLLVLVLVLVLFKGKFSNAYCPKGLWLKKRSGKMLHRRLISSHSNNFLLQDFVGLNVADEGCNVASNGEPLAIDSKSQSGLRELKISMRARKMAFDGIMRLSKMREIGLCEKTWITSTRASRKRRRKVSFNIVKGQQNMRSLLSKKEELAGFGASIADYKGPKHHPPKNN